MDLKYLFDFFFLRNNPNVLRHELKGFEAPEFMLKKMRFSLTRGRMVKTLETLPEFNLPSQNNASIVLPNSTIDTTISECPIPVILFNMGRIIIIF